MVYDQRIQSVWKMTVKMHKNKITKVYPNPFSFLRNSLRIFFHIARQLLPTCEIQLNSQ